MTGRNRSEQAAGTDRNTHVHNPALSEYWTDRVASSSHAMFDNKVIRDCFVGKKIAVKLDQFSV